SAARVMASPATRRRAHEAGVDLTLIHGSGPGGRITADDVTTATERASPSVPKPVAPEHAAPKPATPQPARQGTEEIAIVGLRRVIAQRMSESKRNIPHFSYVEEIDVTELESLRAHLNEKAGRNATPLSYLPFIVVALTRALERFPQCNALYDAERNVIVRHRAVHLGVATQTPEGLLVPVLRNAESLSVTQIAEQIRGLAERARLRKSPREELSGSTITLSSLGKLGGIASTPVINAPAVAIVGVNRSVERPMFVNGVVVARRMMNLSSSFDHRFVDGYDAASMIQEVKGMLEHPATLFMRAD
ncbi:MAG: dihydrolipoamide acetyltransferase family protein, partial [Gammaproteobacteria bacterium]